MRRILAAAGFATLAGVSATSAQADVSIHFGVDLPGPVPVVLAPQPQQVWVPGRWEWTPRGYVWIEGFWRVVAPAPVVAYPPHPRPHFGWQPHHRHHQAPHQHPEAFPQRFESATPRFEHPHHQHRHAFPQHFESATPRFDRQPARIERIEHRFHHR